MSPIERVERPTVARFRRDYLRPRRPVVLVGGSDHWRAREWTFGGLAEQLGDSELRLATLNRGHVRVDRTIAYQTMSARAFLAHVERVTPPDYYLRLKLSGRYRFLRDDVEVPPYCVGRVFLDVSLLIGGTGTNTDTHYDMLHNLVAQLRGRRRVTLFAPADSACLYPYPLRSLRWNCSRVQVESPDPVRFPRFCEATPVHVELGPGDMLFIPRGWWHYFETLEPSIAVHFFWLTPWLVPALAAARVVWMAEKVRAIDARVASSDGARPEGRSRRR